MRLRPNPSREWLLYSGSSLSAALELSATQQMTGEGGGGAPRAPARRGRRCTNYADTSPRGVLTRTPAAASRRRSGIDQLRFRTAEQIERARCPAYTSRGVR